MWQIQTFLVVWALYYCMVDSIRKCSNDRIDAVIPINHVPRASTNNDQMTYITFICNFTELVLMFLDAESEIANRPNTSTKQKTGPTGNTTVPDTDTLYNPQAVT